MSEWKAKRFWTRAAVVTDGPGWTVQLDGRPVKTPAKAPLRVPTPAMAEAIAAEWNAQTDKIDPGSMPATRAANAAIDKVGAQRDEVIEMLAAYGGSDLLCYRAENPPALVDLQTRSWDPVLAWAADALGVRLALGAGVMPVAQPAGDIARLRARLEALDNFGLAAAHDLISLTGSLVLALAVIDHHLTPDAAWGLSRLDEEWQIAQWGADDEAAEAAAVKKEAFLAAERFYRLSLS